jgi:gas vesicle protein GvpA/GvpJ/GvpM family
VTDDTPRVPPAPRARPPVGTGTGKRAVAGLLDSPNASLVDLVDNLLDRGVVLDGEVVLGLADVDLIYLRLSVLLVAADRVLTPKTETDRPAGQAPAKQPREHKT